MSLYIGTDEPESIYIGTDEVEKVYLGTDLVWQKAPATITVQLFGCFYRSTSTGTNSYFIKEVEGNTSTSTINYTEKKITGGRPSSESSYYDNGSVTLKLGQEYGVRGDSGIAPVYVGFDTIPGTVPSTTRPVDGSGSYIFTIPPGTQKLYIARDND